MQILFIRHAWAEDYHRGQSDAQRPLTEEGSQRMEMVARDLRRQVPKLAELASSPYLRAQQTAAILARVYDNMPVTTLQELAPSVSRKEIAAWLDSLTDNSPVGLVGHEPDLSGMIAWLLTGDQGGGYISMKKGQIACVEIARPITAGSGILRWSVVPTKSSGAKSGE